MAEPHDLPPLREVIRRYQLSAFKGLGQHFLLDGNMTAKIARAAGDLAGRTVYEGGPGPGGLTRALPAAGAARVIAVERDGRCREALAELATAYPGRLDVIDGDALRIDERSLLPPGTVTVANLPYNISGPLVARWLERLDLFHSLTLMFQREVAERLAAPPGGKTYGRLSVLTQWACEVKTRFDLPPQAFVPPPKVWSRVVSLLPRPEPLAPADPAVLHRVVAAAFSLSDRSDAYEVSKSRSSTPAPSPFSSTTSMWLRPVSPPVSEGNDPVNDNVSASAARASVSSAERLESEPPVLLFTPRTASLTDRCSASTLFPLPVNNAFCSTRSASKASTSSPSPPLSSSLYTFTSSISLAANANFNFSPRSRSIRARTMCPRAFAWILAAARCSSSSRNASLRGLGATDLNPKPGAGVV